MVKTVALTLSLLTSLCLASAPTVLAQTQPPANPTRINQPQTATPIKLTIEDLPAGFQEIPAPIAAVLAAQLQVLKPHISATTLQPENFFAFFNQDSLQIVFGVTGNVANPTQQDNFDADLQKMQQPEVQKEITTKLQERLKAFGGIEFVEYKAIPEMTNLASTSNGWTLGLNIQGKSLRMDVAGFRRDAVGAFTAVVYLNNQDPSLSVVDVARKLDSRILKTNPAESLSSLRDR